MLSNVSNKCLLDTEPKYRNKKKRKNKMLDLKRKTHFYFSSMIPQERLEKKREIMSMNSQNFVENKYGLVLQFFKRKKHTTTFHQ